MRLRRIEAAAFGALSNRSLGDLGDGLTVVSVPMRPARARSPHSRATYCTASRPAREKEPQYTSAVGRRAGRLVFDDGDGSWVIERTEGPHGGPLSVRTLAGVARPGLHGEITAGVSALAYKIVFGFGLDEMAAIEAQRGSGDDIIAKLYAASAGSTPARRTWRARSRRKPMSSSHRAVARSA